METPYRSSRIADLSAEDRPREKALAIGVEALTTTELVALLLGSGTPGESVINLSQRILADSGNSLQELSRRTIRNLVRSFKGVGDAKAVTLLAAIEKAVATKTWQDFLVSGAYDERPGFAKGKELTDLFEGEYKTFTDYLAAENVLVKNYYK